MIPVRPTLARIADAALEAPVAPSFSRVGYAVRSRLERWEEATALDGAGRRVLVTGVNSGLGFAATSAILRAGGHVIGTVRSEAKGERTRSRLADELGADVAVRLDVEVADLTDLASVRALADRCIEVHLPLDAIVHNAGAMFAEHALTRDGLERTYQVHVVAPFLLTDLLVPHLRAGARVVTVTSGGMYSQALDVDRLTQGSGSPRVDDPPTTSTDTGLQHPYRGSVAYALAKRAQVALTGEWARRRSEGGITFHAVHPGWALTPGVEASLPTFRRVTGPVLRSPDEGADTTVWLALASDVPGNGDLWHDRRRRAAHKVPWTRRSPGETARLWSRVAIDADLDRAGTAISPPGDPRGTPGRPVGPRR